MAAKHDDALAREARATIRAMVKQALDPDCRQSLRDTAAAAFDLEKTHHPIQALLIALFQANGARIAKAEARIAELEARPMMKFCGVYDGTAEYEPGNVVTHQGSSWHCNIKSKGARPGDGVLWTLMVKKGRDA
jgi:hypothetical protein